MQTLSGIIKRILKYKKPELFSMAYGPVTFDQIGPDDVIIAYEKRVTDEYYESLMRIGDVCLVKSDEGTEWKLAIYDGKFDGKFKAKVGVDSEVFPYCISYQENSGYLGRAAFPDWMLSEGSEIETP